MRSALLIVFLFATAAGTGFHSPDGWFSITPPPGWEWKEVRADVWVAQDPATGDNFGVLESYVPGADPVNSAFLQKYEADARHGVAPGDSLSDFKIALTAIPARPSVRFSYKITGKDGEVSYRFGYISGEQHKVTMITTSETATEPAWFADAARSLRWLKAP